MKMTPEDAERITEKLRTETGMELGFLVQIASQENPSPVTLHDGDRALLSLALALFAVKVSQTIRTDAVLHHVDQLLDKIGGQEVTEKLLQAFLDFIKHRTTTTEFEGSDPDPIKSVFNAVRSATEHYGIPLAVHPSETVDDDLGFSEGVKTGPERQPSNAWGWAPRPRAHGKTVSEAAP